MTKQPRVIGYWATSPESASSDNLPYPVESTKNWEDKTKFLTNLRSVEKSAKSQQVVSYRGFSLCRICGTPNGCSEFELGDFVWPSGFSHYVRNHNVMPPQAFVEFINRLADEQPT